ncbi:ion channel [Saccharospirillum salsuginis]|uniref:Potassium channel domain-containing protein n=1 Tax=Saccharospirillum salsuginis TaxID=418750 RepID=A0A918KAS2_9GAMM|nr:ion channel [Saccharospirillum salsuginis]GGX56262.1 hypothetical protein GCM10007392_25070 [Saccharospirillum salsuginis]
MNLDTAHLLVAGTTIVLVIFSVLLHYESFFVLSRHLDRTRRSQRYRILVLFFSLLVIHVIQIWLFGSFAWWLSHFPQAGNLTGPYPLGMLDYIYMSAITYTTLGYGDLIPVGPIRFVYGTEGLVGFGLITWSATMTFLEVQKHWQQRH